MADPPQINEGETDCIVRRIHAEPLYIPTVQRSEQLFFARLRVKDSVTKVIEPDGRDRQTLVEYQVALGQVKVENFNRSPVFGRATFGLTKADGVAAFLAGSGLSATPVPEWWDEFVQRRGRLSFDYDVWLPLANEFGVRHAMQHSVPPLMIHASTTSNWGVNHGRHLPR